MVRVVLSSQRHVSLTPLLIGVFSLIALTGCGGGGGSQGSHTPPPAPLVLAYPTNTDTANPANLANNIWTIDANGTNATELTSYQGNDNVTAQSLQPIWSPNGSQIAYVSDGAFDGSDNLAQYYYFWIMNADGSGKTPLSNVGPAAYNIVGNAIDWSHDGSKLAVAAAPGNEVELFVMNPDGSNPTLVTAPALGPVWSPDDTQLAFEGSNNDIWTVGVNGSGLTALTNVGVNQAAVAPVWSPDGTMIAFSIENLQFGGFTIQTMNANGTNLQSNPGSSYFYSHMVGRVVNWSPDGSKLVFTSTAALDGNPNEPDVDSLNIWVMNADGSGRQPLTQYTADSVAMYVPTWSPDGSTIAFLSSAPLDGSDEPSQGTWCVWTVSASGDNLAPLSALANGTGWNTYWLQPAWQP